ncbi:MAG: bifunctional 5,10-methylenetetrahydrofolate dehydrogenase/5,10-methenyltetrahydrofolate cyclohydrolase [Peptoniphilus sp.]|nr:bifunctional 5,10-methylenetetrahydrofolate dehydrogenase/5,10-methenyltetrahydrofolate cyclohydrolase [Peptoniphilus sp.]
MTKVLDSTELYDEIIAEIKEEIAQLTVAPKISILRFGAKGADLAYERGIKKSADLLGIGYEIHELDENAEEDSVLNLIDKINKDDSIGGILVFRPYPDHLDAHRINNLISPKKDLDCVNPLNKAKVFSGDVEGFIPLAPKASIRLLDHYGIDLEGKDCVVINHSDVVGKPLEMILLTRWATVTLCHVKTRDLKFHTKNADIVFTAMGVAEMLDESYFTENSTVIDIGLSKNAEGKWRGDLNAAAVDGKIKAYSPVPKGVGSITNLLLLQSSLNFYK